MNFILCGDDAAVTPLLLALAADPGHRLTAAISPGGLGPIVARHFPDAAQLAGWDELAAVEDVDAAIIASHDERVLEAARQLAAAGKPLLIFPRAAQGSVFVYELTLVRDDAGSLLCPMLPIRLHPLAARLRAALAEGRLGDVLHLELTRERVRPPGEASGLLTQSEIDEALLADVDLLRSLGGDYNRVTALTAGQTSEGTALATVSLGGPGLPEATWTLRPTDGRQADDSTDRSPWTLVATGQRGRAALGADGGALALELPGEPEPLVAEQFDSGPALLEQFLAAHAGQTIRPDWTDLTRAFEVVDATRRSRARRRTIDLHFETASERNQFKTQMTAIGCGLLSVTFVAVLGLLMAGALFDPRDARETRADAIGFIVRKSDFIGATDELNADGAARVADVAARIPGVQTPVLVEQETAPPSPLDERRRDAVIERLEQLGRVEAKERTLLTELHGEGFRRVMRVLRFVVFLPLFLFLILQALLLIARPSSLRRSSAPASDPP